MDFQREFRKRALIARVLSRVWRVYGCAALQTCATFLAFGGFGVVYCSKCGEFVSRLECLSYFSAPNVRVLSRIWRVVAGLSLQTCATFPAFVVGFAEADHICRVFLWRLLSVLPKLTTFAV